MFKTILIAVDGSLQSEYACARAVKNMEAEKADIHAIYVVSPKRHMAITSELGDKGMDSSHEIRNNILEKEEKKIVSRIQKIIREAGFEVTMHTKVGDPRSEIINLADELDADLIVIGSTGKGLGQRIFLGSVSTFIVTHSNISTLVVRE